MLQRSARTFRGRDAARRRRRPWLRLFGFVVGAGLVGFVSWLLGVVDPPGLASPAPWAASQIGSVPVARLESAKAALAGIEIVDRASKAGYARERFGQAWDDVDRNGCDTRNDILGRDLRDVVHLGGAGRCIVSSGTLSDPYTLRDLQFKRGERSRDVQIDHLVALSDAWQKGAQQWTAERRRAFANDPANLLAVDGPANQDKGDGDLAAWLPPARSFRCEYAVRIVEVKAAYELRMTEAEYRKAKELLGQCRTRTE